MLSGGLAEEDFHVTTIDTVGIVRRFLCVMLATKILPVIGVVLVVGGYLLGTHNKQVVIEMLVRTIISCNMK